MKTTKKVSDLSRLRNMEVGAEETFPISKMSNIRTMSVSYGKQWGKKFSTKTDDCSITVTRVS